MCGIFGYSIPDGVVTPEERAILAAALGKGNDNRGGDSWGVYYVNGEVKIVRGLGKITKGFKWGREIGSAHTLMGHTRKATVGEIKVENAHPFVIGNIVGAHNGHISNHTEMNEKYNRKFDVDSMHIFAHIQKGWKIDELTGYGAIEYVNQKKAPDKINLCKVTMSGDLEAFGIGDQDHCHGVIWSSSKYHLEDAIELAGLGNAVFQFKLSSTDVYFAQGGKLFEKGKKLELGQTQYKSQQSFSSPYTACDADNWQDWQASEEWRTRFAGKSTRVADWKYDTWLVHEDADFKSYTETNNVAKVRALFYQEQASDSSVDVAEGSDSGVTAEQPKVICLGDGAEDPKAASDAIVEQLEVLRESEKTHE